MHTLSHIIEPHRVRDDAKLASLIDAYQNDQAVNPIVLIEDGHGNLYAISGSHRIAALREVYEASCPVSSLIKYGYALIADRPESITCDAENFFINETHEPDLSVICQIVAHNSDDPKIKSALADQF